MIKQSQHDIIVATSENAYLQLSSFGFVDLGLAFMLALLRAPTPLRRAAAPRLATGAPLRRHFSFQMKDEKSNASFVTLLTWGSFYVAILGGAALGILQWCVAWVTGHRV